MPTPVNMSSPAHRQISTPTAPNNATTAGNGRDLELGHPYRPAARRPPAGWDAEALTRKMSWATLTSCAAAAVVVADRWSPAHFRTLLVACFGLMASMGAITLAANPIADRHPPWLANYAGAMRFLADFLFVGGSVLGQAAVVCYVSDEMKRPLALAAWWFFGTGFLVVVNFTSVYNFWQRGRQIRNRPLDENV